MATTGTRPAAPTKAGLQELAKRHLWMHFTRHGAFDEADVPIIVRGEGPYVWDEHGNRYLDGLSALFCVNVGHGRTELGEAAARQVEELDFFTIWSYAHPRAIELATRIASLAPGDLNRVFFTSGGSEAVESAIKLARAYHQRTGNARKTKFITREIAYHGTTLGALAATGISDLRHEFEPLVPGGLQVPNTNSYHWPADRDPLWAADQIEERILYEHPDTVAAVILEPLQNAGGCIPPQEGYFQRVREICDRHNVLLISDEVICAWGRLGHWFGCERYGYLPDIMTMAKALTSAYVPMGGVVVSDRVAEPFMHGKETFTHGFTFAGHPVASAVAMANLDVFEREDICGHVLRKEGELRGMLDSLRDIPIVGDVRGDGFFHAIELVKDQETKEGFTDEESEWLLRGFLSGELFRRGLICRADDRGDPVIQLAPPLICDTEQFEEIESVLRPVLTEAWERVKALMLTVGSLVGDCGLELAAGTDGAERPIRWVHISELEDPTPWLSGGELLLTTGIQLKGAARQRRFLARLAERGVAGLGLGHGVRAQATAEAARGRGLQARHAAVRGPLRDAVHRDHGARLREAGQRAVRGAGARRPGARAAGAAGDRGTRAGGDPRLDRGRDRRLGDRSGRDRPRARPPPQQGRPRRRGPEGARGRGRRAAGDARP